MRTPVDRYHRQALLPQVGQAGQQRIGNSRVMLIGVGALGCVVADHLVRAGVGSITLIDRDVVEPTNLQRQTLFDESDARAGLPKVEAATRRLSAINSGVRIDPRPIDLDAANLEPLLRELAPHLMIDGTDNASTRYLLNDAAVKLGLPWVLGGVIGTQGRAMLIHPGGPCLRCVWPNPPAPGELATCDTAGVLGPAIGVVGSIQAAIALRWLTRSDTAGVLARIDLWTMRLGGPVLTDARNPACPCCGGRHFDFLDSTAPATARVCGRGAVQVRPPLPTRIDLAAIRARLEPLATVNATQLMLKLVLHERPGLPMNLFADGRMLVFGTDDLRLARSIYARVVGI